MKKIIFLISSISLIGCGTPYVKYRFNDTNAVVVKSNGQQESASWHPVVTYPEVAETVRNGQCANVYTPLVIWNDGTKLQPHLIRICSTMNEYRVIKPTNITTQPQFQPIPQPVQIQNNQQNSSSNNQNTVQLNIEDAKKKCLDLGFKTGTEGFGKCVLQFSK
jgi:hypothetical protein